MTYRQLLEALQSLTRAELDYQDVTICLEGEYLRVADFRVAENDGVLDEGHKVLVVEH